MNKISTYFLAAAVALALAACNNDYNGELPPASPSGTLGISASIDDVFLSRALAGSWEAGDRIGVIATVGDLAPESYHPYVNLEYTTPTGSTTFTGTEMLFYNHLTLSAYHPYRGSEGQEPGDTDGFIIKANTRIENQFENNKAIDFLHASKTGIKLAEAENVLLSFSHKMTKLTFTFMSNTDKKNQVNVANLARYQIEGLVMDGTFNTLTGECIAEGGAPAEELIDDGLFIRTESGAAPPEKRTMNSLIVFPQTPNAEVKLRMFLDEAQNGNEEEYQVYFCTIKFGDNQLKPGYHYNFKVNITKAGLQLGSITINNWEEGVNSTIIATIDGDEPEFEEDEED